MSAKYDIHIGEIDPEADIVCVLHHAVELRQSNKWKFQESIFICCGD